MYLDGYPSSAARQTSGPEVASGPSVSGRREVRLTAQLVGALFAYAENLGDVNDSKERPLRHSP
jgi:hypothetical protein